MDRCSCIRTGKYKMDGSVCQQLHGDICCEKSMRVEFRNPCRVFQRSLVNRSIVGLKSRDFRSKCVLQVEVVLLLSSVADDKFLERTK